MDKDLWKQTIRVRCGKWYLPIKVSVFRGRFYCNGGLWPFGIRVWKWGIGFHWRTIADAYIRVGDYR